MDLATLRDRALILDRCHDYAAGIDARDFSLVRSVFTTDATLDYRAVGGPRGPRDAVVSWLAQMLTAAVGSQHLLGNLRVVIEGDVAWSSLELINPLVLPAGGDDVALHMLGGRYNDRWLRAGDQWRIAERVHTLTWRAGPVPAHWLSTGSGAVPADLLGHEADPEGVA